jgi:hypothetical protein
MITRLLAFARRWTTFAVLIALAIAGQAGHRWA